jgi:hypothetical protein
MIGMLLLLVLLVACKGPTAQTCDSKDCFITKANNCENVNMNVTEDFGMMNYAAKDCIFTKTLLSTNGTEETNTLLDGKSLTCKYEKTKFDSRWVNSIVFGIEYCEGELKDRIVDMMAFLQ